MVKYLVVTAALLCGLQTSCMESDASKEEIISLTDIVSFCEKAGNPELAQIYERRYEEIKITDEYQKMQDHSIYRAHRDQYKKYDVPANTEKGTSSCPVCRNVFEHGRNEDTTTVLCCMEKFHIRCLVNWMVTGNTKTCPICRATILS